MGMKRWLGSKHGLILGFGAVLCAVLVVRLMVLTVLDYDKWRSYADNISMRAVYETAPRGDILDRDGEILATSEPVYSVNISKVGVSDELALHSAASVMNLLGENGENVEITQDEVRETLKDGGYNSYLPIVLSESVSRATAEKIEAEDYPGVQIAVNYIRKYPEGALASHVLGYMGRISEDEEDLYVGQKGYREDALVGKSGVEKIFEEQLKGQDAVSKLQIDSSGDVTRVLSESGAKKGEDVRLTIDLKLQRTVENALEQGVAQAASGGVFSSEYGDYSMTYAKNAAVGAAVVLDVDTGEVLALANTPDFDPNDFAVSISAEKWKSLQREDEDDPLSPAPLYNVATMSAVQPGSAFKPVTALAALECGLDENRYLYDAGHIELGEQSYGCFLWNENKGTHGYVNLAEAMEVSCNYYFYDIASGRDFASDTSLGYSTRIDNNTVLSCAKRLGLGEKTGIEIAESAGVLPSEERKEESMKEALVNSLLAERETYFQKNLLQSEKKLISLAEKIANWGDKDLTLEEIIGKLEKESSIKQDKVYDLACMCKYDYFNQMGWSQGDTFNISIGQGDNAYTTLQMASYMATLGNGGVRNRVSLAAGSSRESERVVSDQEHLDTIIEAMTEVTAGDEGSLRRAFAAFPYEVAAKTGTAQRTGYISTGDEKEYLRRHLHLIAPDVTFDRVLTEARRLQEDYSETYSSEDKALRRAVINLSDDDISYDKIDAYKETYDNFAWTVALAPADDPEIAVAVMLVQGKTSSNTAPIVREIIGKYGESEGWEKSF